jgi:hypothetical protein
VTGDRFWLHIASFATRPVRFTGTFEDGKIDARASRPILDNGVSTALRLIGSPMPVR